MEPMLFCKIFIVLQNDGFALIGGLKRHRKIGKLKKINIKLLVFLYFLKTLENRATKTQELLWCNPIHGNL